ncbi:MAG: GNAT family N-acetyltransferase [Phycisphaerae bacterium]|nr:GNAT family N-acetyltransferase [Phycisphaerae bacterium]
MQALLRSDRGAADRFLNFAREHRIRLDGMWARLDDAGRMVMAALASPGAGRTATLFATAARAANDIAPLSDLLRRVLHGLAFPHDQIDGSATTGEATPLDIDLVQTLIDPSEFRQAEAISRSGMARLAELSYLERATPRGPILKAVAGPGKPIAEWPSDIRAERWDPANRRELIQTLERSYVGTLDCPALAGLRRGEDVLEGHMHSGTFEPSLWTVLRFISGPHEGHTAGVCLFNSSTSGAGQTGSLELVYFGLVPEARGRGLGRTLLRHALDGLRERREATVLLAVDDRNEPAHRLYREAGFRTRFRRIAYIHSLRSAGRGAG